MRGADEQPGSMFSYVSLEARVPADHPLRAIRGITDRALDRLSPRFGSLYVNFGRPSIPPEQLLRALLLQALYTIRSERQLMEQLDYNLLFRWFVGLGMDDAVWSPTTFSKNRDRLLDGDVAGAFFEAVRIHADSARLLSDDHFTVDGTLLEAWASQKSFRPRDQDPPTGGGNPTVNFHGQRRSNATHQSTTDPDARLYKKARGREARLRVSRACVDGAPIGVDRESDSHASRWAWRTRCGRGDDRRASRALGVPGKPWDKGYDSRAFVVNLRAMHTTPYMARSTLTAHRGSAIDGRHDARQRLAASSVDKETQNRGAELRLDENHRGPAEAPSPRRPLGDLDLHLRGGGI